MKVFLWPLGEKVWQAVEVGWIKPKEASMDWDEATIKVENFNNMTLNALFSGVTNKDLRKYHPQTFPRKHGPFLRLPMKVSRQ